MARPTSTLQMRGGQDPALGAQPQHAPSVHIQLLGGFAFSVNGHPLDQTTLRLRKAASVIKLLALAPEHRLGSEALMELLWPELDPDKAVNRFHQVLHEARRVIALVAGGSVSAKDILSLHQQRLSLQAPGGLTVDVEEFEAAAAAARRAAEPVAYEAAIARYAGDLLPDDPYEDWLADRREALRETHLALLLELARLWEVRQEYSPAIATLQQVIARDPAREEAHVGLMRLYAITGRRQLALRQFHELRDALWKDLEVTPDETSEQLHDDILNGRFRIEQPAVAALAPTRATHNLPAPLTSFIGREQEVDAVSSLLTDARLVTLTGPGGCGKSRLALAIASRLLPDYPDGVWLVELAALADPELLSGTIASVLGVREEAGRPLRATLEDALRAKQLLLVLDNCEHVIDAAPRVAELLRACPSVKILATSREALHIRGEREFRVPPLDIPDAALSLPPEQLADLAAVRLFQERAEHVRPDFELTGQNVPVVAEICRRLDGLPLAIELAAVRVRLFTVEELLERLDRRLPLLTGGARDLPERQQTLRGTIAWSYDLLDVDEQELYRQAAVFTGGFTIEAADAVVAPASAGNAQRSASAAATRRILLLDALDSLISKSLLHRQQTHGGASELRFGLLETIREFGLEQLDATGEIESARRRHAAYYLELAETAEPELWGADQGDWLARLGLELENLRAALAWSLESDAGDAELGMRLAGALWHFWEMRGEFTEGRAWLERALACDGSSRWRAAALTGAGTMAWSQGDIERAALYHREALALYREQSDQRGIAFALNNLGVQAFVQGDPPQAASLMDESLVLYRQQDDRRGIADVLNNLGVVAQHAHDYELAARYYEESLALRRTLEDRHCIANVLYNLGEVAYYQHAYERATILYGESLTLRRELGSPWGAALCLAALADLALHERRWVRAARLGGAAEALIETTGIALDPTERNRLERIGATVGSELGQPAGSDAWATGKSFSFETAIRCALNEDELDTDLTDSMPLGTTTTRDDVSGWTSPD